MRGSEIIGGVDSGIVYLDNCWDAIFGFYGAYVHGREKWNGWSKIEQDGGYLGFSAAFYRGAFFTAATVNDGYFENRTRMDYGNDKFDTMVSGAAIKSGLNIPVFDSFTVQPNLYASYTYVNSESYTNVQNIKMKIDGLHVYEVAPGIKIEKKAGDFGVFAVGRYVWNFFDGGDIKANEALLPDVAIKPYIEYGVRFENNSNDFSLFGQITRRDGGRDGWNAELGVRYAF